MYRTYLSVLSQAFLFSFQCLFLPHPLTPSLFHHLPRVKGHSRATRDGFVIGLTRLSGRVLLALAVETQLGWMNASVGLMLPRLSYY